LRTQRKVVDVFAGLDRKLTRLYRQPAPAATGIALLGDARDAGVRARSALRARALPDRARLVVTSPPYLRVVKYGYYNWLRTWLLGFDARAIDAELDDAHQRDVAHGLIISAFRDRKSPWGAALIAKARAEHWGDTALLTILRALPIERWTWDRVAEIGGEIETTYWRRAPVFWMSDDSEDVAYAIRKLINDGKTIDVQVHVEDPGAFTTPWNAIQRYRRADDGPMIEMVCAENNVSYFNYDVVPIPQADKADF